MYLIIHRSIQRQICASTDAQALIKANNEGEEKRLLSFIHRQRRRGIDSYSPFLSLFFSPLSLPKTIRFPNKWECNHTHTRSIGSLKIPNDSRFHAQIILPWTSIGITKKGKYCTVLFLSLSLSRSRKDKRWTNMMNVVRKRLQCKYVQSSRLILAPPSFSFSSFTCSKHESLYEQNCPKRRRRKKTRTRERQTEREKKRTNQ